MVAGHRNQNQNLHFIFPKDNTTVKPNDFINIEGRSIGFRVGTQVLITLGDKTQVSEIRIDGYWSVTIVVPGTFGNYELKASIGNISKSISIIVEESEEEIDNDKVKIKKDNPIISILIILIIFREH